MTAAELLSKHGINITLGAPGEYRAICTQCSPKRKKKTEKDLSVGLKEDGGVTWFCHHCGWRGPEKGPGAKKEIIPTHIYRDAAGVIRFGKVRNPPGAKDKYWLCHPTGSGGWEKGAKGIDTTILYRADEVAEAIKTGREICCVEGEKDADNLWRLDIPATCNAHGAHDPALNQKPKSYVANSFATLI